jgi:predicted GNAT superfamily acetyltransferase
MLTNVEEAHNASQLFADIWATRPRVPMSTELLRALAHAGNYVSGAWRGGQLVGASVAFFGQDRGSWILHSHITGVLAPARRTGVAFALKLHQRAWALERGISEITWTFDPLVRRNARFNLIRLAAIPIAYEQDFYGRMKDGINAGDDSDRLLVVWPLEAATVVAASEEIAWDPGDADRLGDTAVVLVRADANGDPVVSDPVDGSARGPFLCETPGDIEALRVSAPARAGAWRRALQATMARAMEEGHVLAGFTRGGWYVLGRLDEEKTVR